ncbi:MAG: RdgB/HAM1 family non-canonical purine NTP pyrophosphatase [Pseudomonadales bacterium]|jgi:XTP/dITP diphosphohydrolase|nr:RdgB/HAM1 family non-canonical purine NTP pyrophosphatase [Pseudomonadales bacterium]MDP6469452.1 RdgB/HAM1 family non-canonical purine NTP pyrophosphatase [Pseudomonadales bacterium]MDP6827294.1 RdgB/HAM1 family non-canonical purine NTP pyrophosphatase [Pseudomonadales bacterium]MDP6971117.1 RdgB/HAM1 family non-canonical purine NTP pyrophosphatase [Pseudomonadales bacterium]|tara:strand:- start:466 stop:1053 length:588 start_codon:yes stop_codon:yes gene_type:complete
MEIVLASSNRGKLHELGILLAPLNLALCPQAELGIESAPETATTFVENALEKARHASAIALRPAIADDSGLVVPALGGQPGIYSARYAGAGADDSSNNAKLLAECRGIADRRAYFYCALVFLRSKDDPAPLLATAAWHGTLIETPRGENGFGYDPLFLLPDLGKTSAELDPRDKNRLSHRGQATAALVEALRAEP